MGNDNCCFRNETQESKQVKQAFHPFESETSSTRFDAHRFTNSYKSRHEVISSSHGSLPSFRNTNDPGDNSRIEEIAERSEGRTSRSSRL